MGSRGFGFVCESLKRRYLTLYQCVQAHRTEFEAVYPTRHQEQYGFFRPVIGRVVEKFFGCEGLTKGFARVRCDTCQHEYLKAQGEERTIVEGFSELSTSAAKRAWARLIKEVYEVDPLICPRCTGPMRIIAFIEQSEVIAKILTLLGRWFPPAHSLPAHSLAA